MRYTLSTIFTLSIGTPYLRNTLVLKFEIGHSTTSSCVLNIFVWMATSVHPDHTLHSVVSDLGLHCLQRPSCPNT